MLLDDYEPGMKTAEVRAVFDELKAGLVPLIAEVAERADAVDDSFLTGEFPIDAQKHVEGDDPRRLRLHRRLLAARRDRAPVRHALGHGRHPADDEAPRRTTCSSIFSSMHEFGHGIYEYGGDRDLRAHAARPRRVARLPRVAEPHVGEPRRPQPALLAALLPARPGGVPVAAERRRRGGLLPRRQPRAAVADPHRRGRGDVQPPHHPPLRAGAGDDHRPARRRRRAGGVGREDAGVPRRRGAGRRRRRAAGHALGGRLDRLLLDVRARQRRLGAALAADLRRDPRRLRADRARRVRRRSASGSASTSTSTGGSTRRRSCCERITGSKMDPKPLLAYLRGKLGEIYALDS